MSFGTCFSPARKVLLVPSAMVVIMVLPRNCVPFGVSPWISAPFAFCPDHMVEIVPSAGYTWTASLSSPSDGARRLGQKYVLTEKFRPAALLAAPSPSVGIHRFRR